jgi:hypothetical protein
MRSHRPQPLPNPCQSSGRNLAALLCLQGVNEVIEGPERMAIFLSFLATGETYSSISTTYDVSPATVINCVKEGVELFRQHLVPAEIKVPSGAELQQVMVDFEALCSMPQCCGAIDGTFMKINKPVKDGDAFYCYKKYPAIIIFACVDARGRFTYVNTGAPGSMGDAAVWNRSTLKYKLHNNLWLCANPKRVNGVPIHPYLVADTAFALSSRVMKCWEGVDVGHGPKYNFNYAVIRTRRVVEQAFGRLKGRFHIVQRCTSRDDCFAANIAMVCCALHNMIERLESDTFDEAWAPVDEDGVRDVPLTSGDPARAFDTTVAAADVRQALTRWVHNLNPAQLVTGHRRART